MNDVKEKTLYLIQFWARFFKNNADYPNFYGFYQMVVNVGVEFPPYNQSPYANKKKRIKKTGALEEANPWDYYIQMKEEEQMNYGGRIGDTGMGPTEAKGFDARAEKLKADLEVVVNNIDLTNNIIDNCIEERRMDELLPEMILTLEGLNQKLNKLVEQLTDKEEERLFNLVLLIIEDINTTKGRYKDLTSRKRPQPFISAYKNSPENDDDHVEAQPKPPVAKPPARKQFGDEEEEEGPGYNQFQFQDDDDDEDEKDNFPRQRAGPPQIPGPAQRPQQPIQQPPQPQRQSQPAFKPTFEGFDNPGQSNFFDTPAAPARGPVQEAPRPAPAKPRQPELDLLGTDAPAGGVKEPPKTGGGVDLLDLGAPAAKPQPQLGMAGMGMMGGPGMMPGAGMMGTPGFGVPGMGGVNPMYGMGMAGIPGMGGMGVAPGMGVNPLMSGPMGLAMSMNPTQPNLLANTGPKLGEKNEIKFSKEVKPDLAKANEPEKYTGNLADIDAMSKDILGKPNTGASGSADNDLNLI